MNVIILAAGAGLRMKDLDFPKPLLLVDGKPLILHVMDAYPKDSKFFVAVNSEAELLKDFLGYLPDDVTIVDVGMPLEPGAGPGTSLRKCLEVVKGPAAFTVADGIYEFKYFNTTSNWLMSWYTPENTEDYCCIRSAHEGVHTVEKQKVTGTWQTWTGVGYIKDWKQVIQNLSEAEVGEKQCSPAWKNGRWQLYPAEKWIDLGTKEKYERAAANSMDYRKPGAFAIVRGDRVIKVFPNTAKAFYDRYFTMGTRGCLGPAQIEFKRRVCAYPLIEGKSFYECGSPELFKLLLPFLQINLWKTDFKKPLTTGMREFYENKTLERARTHLGAEPELNVDWSMFDQGIITYVHGDLQFDNIIVDIDGGFRLIDWREGFTQGCFLIADVYYDLGKLLSGILLDIGRAKKGPQEDWIRPVERHEEYIAIFKEFHEKNNLDWKKTQTIAATCFISMAGVHTEPYASAFYKLGLKSLGEIS